MGVCARVYVWCKGSTNFTMPNAFCDFNLELVKTEKEKKILYSILGRFVINQSYNHCITTASCWNPEFIRNPNPNFGLLIVRNHSWTLMRPLLSVIPIVV